MKKNNAFDKEYFFILPPRDDRSERVPNLSSDADTAAKPYKTEVLPIGGKPLIFYNGYADIQRERGTLRNSPPGPILFHGVDLVVREEIANKLWDLEPPIPNLAIQPAIYIDHKDKWYENYWFLTFTTKFDCWDRENSDYNHEPFGLPGMYMYSVYGYSLNEEMLRSIPLSERRLFEIGATLEGFVVVHESLADLFRSDDVDLVRIDEF
jgi:hypothetical protein